LNVFVEVRITYRHVSGCLVGDCPNHSDTIRSADTVDRVIEGLIRKHSDFPIEIEGVEELRGREHRVAPSRPSPPEAG
jgi:hypothetical protein